VLLSQLKENIDDTYLYLWEGYLTDHVIPLNVSIETEQNLDDIQKLMQTSWNFFQLEDIIPKTARFLRDVEKQTGTRDTFKNIAENFIHQQGGTYISRLNIHIPANWDANNNQRLINLLAAIDASEHGEYQGGDFADYIPPLTPGKSIDWMEFGGDIAVAPYQWTRGFARDIKQTHLISINRHVTDSGLEGLFVYEYEGPSFVVYD